MPTWYQYVFLILVEFTYSKILSAQIREFFTYVYTHATITHVKI